MDFSPIFMLKIEDNIIIIYIQLVYINNLYNKRFNNYMYQSKLYLEH